MSSKYRVDIAQDYERLMQQAAEHWDRVDRAGNSGLPEDSGFTREPSRRQPSAPAHPRYDFEAAKSYNLVAADYVKAEAFGRKQLRRPVVKTSGGQQLGGKMPQMPPHQRVGDAGLPPPSAQGQQGLPGWKAARDPFEDPAMSYENAISVLESRGRMAAHALVAGLRLEGGAPKRSATPTGAPAGFQPAEVTVTATNVVASRSEADVTFFDPEADRTHVFATGRGQDAYDGSRAELTNPDFTWVTGASYWEELVGDVSVVGGASAWTDVERTLTVHDAIERTLTNVAFGRPPSA